MEIKKMKNPILTPEEAIEHIKSRSAFRANLRSLSNRILNWAIEWNEAQPPDNRVLCFLREDVNVGFFIDRDGNRNKNKRPNFLVIKAETDLLDFSLGRLPDERYRRVFQQLKGNETRWRLRNEQFSKATPELLHGAFLVALKRQLL